VSETNESPESPSVLTCSIDGCDKVVHSKKLMLCMTHYQAQRRERLKPPEMPADLGARVSQAKTTEDWQKIAAAVAPVMQGILDGQTKASAAQVSLLKDILNRAYGKPVATQHEKRVAAGVIVLPALDTGAATTVCPKCGYDATKTMDVREPTSPFVAVS
jgi:hypothetical protein